MALLLAWVLTRRYALRYWLSSTQLLMSTIDPTLPRDGTGLSPTPRRDAYRSLVNPPAQFCETCQMLLLWFRLMKET